MAEVIRRSVDNMLDSEVLPDKDELKDRARAAFGAFSDSCSDTSANHDNYFPGAFEQ